MIDGKEGNAPEPSPSSGGVSRREFLKLAGLSLGGLVVGPRVINAADRFFGQQEEGIDLEKDSYHKLNFVEDPRLLADMKFVERIKGDMSDFASFVDEAFRRDQREFELEETGVDLSSWGDNIDKLVGETVKWGHAAVEVSRGNQAPRSSEEVFVKYHEYSTFLRSILLVHEEYGDRDPYEVYNEFIVPSSGQENISNVINQQGHSSQEPLEGYLRSDLKSLWSYEWQYLAKGDIASNLLFFPFFDSEGASLDWIPLVNSSNFFPDYGHQFRGDPEWLWLRPEEAEIIDLDEEVQDEVVSLLKHLGINRVMKSIGWAPAGIPQGNTFLPTGDISMGTHETLNLEGYRKYPYTYNKIVLHEAMHALGARSTILNTKDRVEFRGLMLEVIEEFDPLSSMQKLFNPDGEYPSMADYEDLIEFFEDMDSDANYLTVTDYGFGFLKGERGVNVQEFAHELRNGIYYLSQDEVDIYKHFYGLDANNLDEVFEELSRKIPDMDRFSRYVSEYLISNREHIMAKKRMQFDRDHLFYLVNDVVPYTLSHLALYKTEDFVDNLPQPKDEKLLESYVSSWYKRLKGGVSRLPADELIADVFASCMLESGDSIEWEGVRDKFARMLVILKKNGLAYKEEDVT